MVEGEFLFTTEDFRHIAEMLHADAGISLPDTKATLVYSRLAKRLRARGLESFREYCDIVASEEGIDERKRMLAALTTNVTRFFREPHHFEHLKTHVLPPLLEAAKRGGRVRLWSAGCSTGQEPFSMALTILSLMPDAADRDIKILATDIDPDVVAIGRRAVYPEGAMAGMPDPMRKRWMSKVDDAGGAAWQMGEELRQLVAFRELNLIGQWPMKGPFDAIFCRNVVIYFAEDTQSRVWARLKSMLAPGGRLYIGHSERITGVADSFRSDGLTTYQLMGGAR
ncbi:Chemotaxis protein methyltransferase CheR [Lutibaculum baratangense AMV1]|uniref:Chemotaxis protein methyltransferase n=1 Tax=Lutibaculum baratangense AMV1 TaxID=631454 RepID=V4RLU3_9HYPH|nr:Chemotaxis protein methyltransferase CheR [Lutibaculum baratangense AMV1]